MPREPRIDCLPFHLEFHEIHARGPFDPVPIGELKDRFVFYHRWLATQGFIDADPDQIDEDFELYLRNITEDGLKFMRKVHDRFVALMVPGRSIEQDRKYLERRRKAIFGS